VSCQLKWSRRDPETGRRMQIEFSLIREKPEWKVHRVRFEEREPYEPEAEDWDALIEFAERNLKRGKVYPEDLKRLKRLRAEATG